MNQEFYEPSIDPMYRGGAAVCGHAKNTCPKNKLIDGYCACCGLPVAWHKDKPVGESEQKESR